jgi:polysaccharide export outer membrane protein
MIANEICSDHMRNSGKSLTVIPFLAALAWVLSASPLLAGGQTAPYRVGPNDVLAVTVWAHSELSGKFTVANDGTISYPLIGSLKVAEQTVPEIQSQLTARLADGFLKKPQVNIEIVQYLSQKVYVMGEVRTPGPIQLSGSTTLLEALARAGSLNEQAGGEVVLLRPAAGGTALGPATPGQDGVTQVARISVQQLRSGSITANVELVDGDTIFVPRGETIYVLGMVNSPGPYPIEPGITTVLRAISLAGGTSQLGTTGRVKVTRVVDGKKTEVKAKLDDLLKPGDTVTVGTRLF